MYAAQVFAVTYHLWRPIKTATHEGNHYAIYLDWNTAFDFIPVLGLMMIFHKEPVYYEVTDKDGNVTRSRQFDIPSDIEFELSDEIEWN